jgi:hypothetical protein
MRASVIRHGKIERLAGEGCIASQLFFGMVTPDGHDNRRVAWMRLRAVKDFTTEINEFHGRVPLLCSV